jgi:competence protein ComEA
VPSDRRLVLLAVIAGVVALVLAGRVLGPGSGSASGTPLVVPTVAVTSTPSDELGPVTVYVVGAVHRPGVLVLPAGSRARDAVRKAGGVLRSADLSQLNLAVRVSDGEMVTVPRRSAPGRLAPAAPTATAAPAIVHLNSATVAQLEELDGIGPSLAARIVSWRAAHGGFHAVDDLAEVSGIGPARLEALRGRVAP